MKQNLIPVFDRAHGLTNPDGTPLIGKASPAIIVPDAFSDDDHLKFRECEFSEYIIDGVISELTEQGYVTERTIANDDMQEPGLGVRKARINAFYNKYKSQGKQILTIPVHVNASGMGDIWKKARGKAYFTFKGQSYSDKMCDRLYAISMQKFPDEHHYRDLTDGDSDMEAQFAVLSALGNGVLLELNFQDNKEDVALLNDLHYRARIINMIVQWYKTENGLL